MMTTIESPLDLYKAIEELYFAPNITLDVVELDMRKKLNATIRAMTWGKTPNLHREMQIRVLKDSRAFHIVEMAYQGKNMLLHRLIEREEVKLFRKLKLLITL